MKPVTRRLRKHYGLSAKRVTVRSQQPWYWQWVMAAGLVVLGYVLAYWQFTGGDQEGLMEKSNRLSQENTYLQNKLVMSDSQLRIEQATQANLSKQLATLQEDNMKLKEDLAVYKNMLSEKLKH